MMVGQGSPRQLGVLSARWTRAAARMLLCLATFGAGVVASRAELPEPERDPGFRLRVAWGGGAPRVWRGSLRIDGGVLRNLGYLGLEADQAATIYTNPQANDTVTIEQRAASQYVGFDVDLVAAETAQMVLELVPSDQPQEMQRVELPLTALIGEGQHRQLDDQNNRLLIQRVGGDDLRIVFERPSLVFAPGEPFSFSVRPNHLGIADGAPLRCHVKLQRSHSETAVWEAERDIRLPPNAGSTVVGPFVPNMPEDEGVYDLIVSLVRPRFRDTFLGSKPLRTRRVQLVVVATESPDLGNQGWEHVESIDPNHASWMEWLTRVPRLPLLPDFRQEPLGNGKARPRDHQGQEVMELPPGGWQAYPLSVRQQGLPHLLVVQYPSDVPQTLGISVLEPNAAGDVVPIQLDSGVDVDTRWSLDEPQMLEHRLVFWPRTQTPLVLLTNGRGEQPAVYGKIKVLAGPQTLPSTQASTVELAPPSPAARRLLAAYFDKPLFPENFSASEALDPRTDRSLDDWHTFLEGGRRLVQYLKYAGYNGAVVSVNCQGSTLYPSRLMTPNPQYDSGTYFASGQDPIRKDALELLFRLFDREGLTLVPAVQFSSTLDELERLRRATPGGCTGIDLVNRQGQRWVDVYPAQRGMAPYYNPLDPRVQQAMRAVLGELSDRYADHAAFGGVGVQLEPSSFALLPGEEWGQDAVTIARFERERTGEPAVPQRGQVDAFRTRDRRRRWLSWRAEVMARFHQDVARQLTERRADARLFLLTGNLFSAPSARVWLRPALPNRLRVGEALAQVGLDIKHYADQPQIVLFRPDRIVNTDVPAAVAEELNLSNDAATAPCFAQARVPGALFYHEASTRPLHSFDEVSPFGPERTRVTLVSHVTPSGANNRQRFVRRLAEHDLQLVLDGGWMLPLGQEETLRPLLQTLGDLPAEPFQTVEANPTGLPSQPLVVRTLSRNGQTFVYVVNNSPWNVSAEVDLDTTSACGFQPLGGRDVPPPQWNRTQTTWAFNLLPYDLMAAVFSSERIHVVTWRATLDRQVFVRLRDQVNAMRSRVNALQHPLALDVLANPGFETDDPLSGWTRARGDEILIEPDSDHAYEGQRSLKMTSHSQNAAAWIRSEPIQPPQTGRISVVARLQTERIDQQPPLRLAVEGRRVDGTIYYKPASVGVGNQPLDSQWGKQPFMLHINDLPVGGWADLRLGFDLMGPGTFWIDDVHVYDLWFLPNERDELMIMTAVATMALNKGHVADTLRVLEGYWPRYLNSYVPSGELRTAALPVDPTPKPPANVSPPPATPSMLDKVKQRLPKRVFPFQLRF